MHYSKIRGAIFDIDDTLLDSSPNGPFGLHEQSRMLAAQRVGRAHDIPGLYNMTEQQIVDAFRYAKQHTLFAAVWEMLRMAGQVTAEDIDFQHPLFIEIVDLKEEVHEEILRTQGREVPGATAFAHQLAKHIPERRLGVASTACRRDIDIFFEMSGLAPLFPDERIISRERFANPKPHPEPFDLAFAALGLPEEARASVIAFEDDPRGIASAKKAGLYVCAITTRYDAKSLAKLPLAPDIIIESYAEASQKLHLKDI